MEEKKEEIMDEKYLPKDFNGKLLQVVEECGEVIQAVCKLKKFGIENYHPLMNTNNGENLLSELHDLKHAITEVEKCLQD